ncbi:hypothetical protein M9Y10_038143 [Tritrichomonas musculus]|uniref:Uncharacterized protein n=1 Tax=Tritrichomonas musculus TaxID=1915356 RepID=A0ABR2K8K9_9EUKA
MQQEIDNLVNKEEIEIRQLKKDLYHLQVENGSSLPQLVDFNIKEEAIVHIGVGRFDYKIHTSTPFEDFDSFIQSIITRGTTKYGFDLNGYIVWLKDDADLKLMYHYYFSNKKSFIHILAIKKSDSFKNIHFIDQILAPNSIPFLYIPSNEKNSGIFLYFPDDYSFDEEQAFFKLFDPTSKSLLFTDSDGDKFNISTETDWNYFLAESLSLVQKGQYMILKGEEN